MTFTRDGDVAPLASAVDSAPDALLGQVDVGELGVRRGQQRGDLGAFEGDRRPFGIVLVVARGIGRALDDVVEVPAQPGDAPQRPRAIVVEQREQFGAGGASEVVGGWVVRHTDPTPHPPMHLPNATTTRRPDDHRVGSMAASTVGSRSFPDPNEGVSLASLRSTTGADSTQARLATASSDHDHLVALYDTDASLVDSVVAFLTPALAADEPMIVLATDQHREQIRTALISARGDRPHDADPPGLVMLDAAETLGRVMVDGAPDTERFRAVIGGAVEAATAGQRGARIFGEMVAILWDDGDIPGAIAVEDLWNDLLEEHHFGLLCGYPSSAFEHAEDTREFHTVCSKHLAVIPTESDASAGVPQQVGADHQDPPSDREQELMAELDRLQELDQLRSRFVAMVAHEVRHPTAVLIALLDLLETSWPELDADEIGDYLHKALSNAHQMDRLTRDILTLSRLEAGEFSYQLGPVDLGEVAARAVDEVSRATGRSIVLALEPGLPAARADADRQRQILQNLLSNAVKFSPDPSAVFVDVDGDPAVLTVSVRDEGAGILAGDRDELFRAFSRPGASGRSTRGAGLGLYITKALVEGQGGTIDVRSVPGSGSTFTYTVPTADA